jgi:hypothetical protein
LERHIVIWLLFSVIAFCGCAGSKQSNTERGTITGRIFVVGNEPFTKIAVETAEGVMVLLRCDKKTEQELRKNQGHTVQIEYDGIEQAPEGRTLRVTKAEISSE